MGKGRRGSGHSQKASFLSHKKGLRNEGENNLSDNINCGSNN